MRADRQRGLLLEALQRIGPEWPKADFDVKAERQRLLDEKPIT